MLIIELIIGKKIFGRQNVGHQKFLVPNNLKLKKIYSNRFRVKNILCSKDFGSRKITSKKIWFKNVGQKKFDHPDGWHLSKDGTKSQHLNFG